MKKTVFKVVRDLIIIAVVVVIGCYLMLIFTWEDDTTRFTFVDNFKKVFHPDKYATDYPLDVGESKSGIKGKWKIAKYETDDGAPYLSVYNPGVKENDNVDLLSFVVFDSSKEAKKYYDNEYKEYGEVLDEGDVWFTAREADVCDADIVGMFFLKDNVIIYADLNISGGMSVDGESSTVNRYYLRTIS